MTRALLCAGALAAAVAVAAGAFGAHALRERLSPRSLELWETAARYLIYGGLGTVLAGLAALQTRERAVMWAGVLLLVGAVTFSGTVFALALDGPRWLGAVTPLGGALMIAGFVVFAWGALRLGGP